MAHPFNGTTFSFTGAAGVGFAFRLKSWSSSGGERPDIDTTGASNTRRETLPGMMSTVSYTFECVYDKASLADDQALIDWLNARLNECDKGTLTFTIKETCSTTETPFSGTGWLINFDTSAALDESINLSLTFLMDD